MFVFSIIFYYLYVSGGDEMRVLDVMLLLILCSIPPIIKDLRSKDIQSKFKKQNKLSYLRIATKLLGLFLTYVFLEFLVWAFPKLGVNFFNSAMDYLSPAIPYIIAVTIPYVMLVDVYLPKPKDAYWHMGNLILRQQKPDYRMIVEHLKSWFIKFFFFALMSVSVYGNFRSWSGWNMDRINMAEGWQESFDIAVSELHRLAYTIDLFYAALGYIMTFKLLGTNIRSSEPTFMGWIFCLICYPPFWPLFNNSFFAYEDNINWRNYYDGNMPVYLFWGICILLCDFIYGFATVAFGYRFSNITYRGIITGGPYRFTKHPAYFFKNLSWWMVSLPFLSYGGPLEAVRNCFMLGCVSFIYYMRARTEENHLSNYPEYVAYAEAMNERSIFRPLAKIFPFLKYSKARADKWNSRVYKPYVEQY